MNLGLGGKPIPIHVRVSQRQPGKCLDYAGIEVRPIERVKEKLGRIPWLTTEVGVTRIVKCAEIGRKLIVAVTYAEGDGKLFRSCTQVGNGSLGNRGGDGALSLFHQREQWLRDTESRRCLDL